MSCAAWHPSGALVVVVSNGGRIFCMDAALQPLWFSAPSDKPGGLRSLDLAHLGPFPFNGVTVSTPPLPLPTRTPKKMHVQRFDTTPLCFASVKDAAPPSNAPDHLQRVRYLFIYSRCNSSPGGHARMHSSAPGTTARSRPLRRVKSSGRTMPSSCSQPAVRRC